MATVQSHQYDNALIALTKLAEILPTETGVLSPELELIQPWSLCAKIFCGCFLKGYFEQINPKESVQRMRTLKRIIEVSTKDPGPRRVCERACSTFNRLILATNEEAWPDKRVLDDQLYVTFEAVEVNFHSIASVVPNVSSGFLLEELAGLSSDEEGTPFDTPELLEGQKNAVSKSRVVVGTNNKTLPARRLLSEPKRPGPPKIRKEITFSEYDIVFGDKILEGPSIVPGTLKDSKRSSSTESTSSSGTPSDSPPRAQEMLPDSPPDKEPTVQPLKSLSDEHPSLGQDGTRQRKVPPEVRRLQSQYHQRPTTAPKVVQSRRSSVHQPLDAITKSKSQITPTGFFGDPHHLTESKK